MKTKNTKTVRQLVLAALFLALAFVLPLLTGPVSYTHLTLPTT